LILIFADKNHNFVLNKKFNHMKNLIFLFSIFTFILNVNAQKISEKDVPESVKTKFASMYPDVKMVKWEMENGKYEAEFKDIMAEKSVIFESNGTHVQTEVEIPVSGIPAAINEYVTKNLAGQKINEATEITSASGTISYEAEIGKTDYLFDANGNFLKKEADSSDTEDDK
jgi:hypothetical protein